MHVRTHTREHLYYCSQCNYSSITKNCLKRHIIQKHSNILLKCPSEHCDYSTPDKYKLQAHLKVHTELVSTKQKGMFVSIPCRHHSVLNCAAVFEGAGKSPYLSTLGVLLCREYLSSSDERFRPFCSGFQQSMSMFIFPHCFSQYSQILCDLRE